MSVGAGIVVQFATTAHQVVFQLNLQHFAEIWRCKIELVYTGQILVAFRWGIGQTIAQLWQLFNFATVNVMPLQNAVDRDSFGEERQEVQLGIDLYRVEFTSNFGCDSQFKHVDYDVDKGLSQIGEECSRELGSIT